MAYCPLFVVMWSQNVNHTLTLKHSNDGDVLRVERAILNVETARGEGHSLYIVEYLCLDLKGMGFGMFCPF